MKNLESISKNNEPNNILSSNNTALNNILPTSANLDNSLISNSSFTSVESIIKMGKNSEESDQKGNHSVNLSKYFLR